MHVSADPPSIDLVPATLTARPRLLEPMVVSLAGLAVLAWLLKLTLLTPLAAILALLGLWAPLTQFRGRVSVGPEGISARYLVRRVNVPWAEVHHLAVTDEPLRQRVQLRRRDGRTFKLPLLGSRWRTSVAFDAAVETLDAWSRQVTNSPVIRKPRTAPKFWATVVVAALIGSTLINRPWYWIAGPEAVATPDPCVPVAAASGRPAESLTSGRWPQNGLDFRSCRVEQGDYDWRVSYYAFSREGLQSGTGRAAAFMSSMADKGYSCGGIRGECVDSTPMDRLDVGDEGYLIRKYTGVAVIRLANVMVIVEYDGPSDGDEPVIALAQTAVDSIPLQ